MQFLGGKRGIFQKLSYLREWGDVEKLTLQTRVLKSFFSVDGRKSDPIKHAQTVSELWHD